MNTMKTSNGCKKMRPRRGFMCQSPASTAICMSTGDPRSVVIIPRRTAADHGSGIDQHSLLLNKNNRHHSSSTTSITSSRCSRLPADSHQSHQHQPRQKFNTASTLDSTHDHYNRRSSSAFIRDDRGGRPIPPPLPPLPTLPSNFQVVVMRVSLHCQGCAGKVKKHISKMEGVTSFSIDLEMKRVTVMGHVSPVGVLESISKVKRAEFWTSSNTITTC